jgi:F-type H+-transporting ATPase subunit epsilon
MKTFVLHLQDAQDYTRIEGVESFVGSDESGAFGLMAGHERFIASLVFGLARFRRQGAAWEYLALPGGLVYFAQDQLFLSTRRLFRDADYQKISGQLMARLEAEERSLAAIHESLQRLEGEMLKRLSELGRGREPSL